MIARVTAKKLSSIVAGKRARKTSKASVPGSTDVELPKSPCMTRPM